MKSLIKSGFYKPVLIKTLKLNSSFILKMNQFFDAIKVGDLEKVKQIVHQFGDVIINTLYSGDGESPLMYAAYYGHLPIVRYLVQNGADVNPDTDSAGNTVLHLAVSDFPSNPDFRGLVKDPKEALGILIYLAEHGSQFGILNINNGQTASDYINYDLLYNLNYPAVNSLDEIKRLYRQMVFTPWKKGVNIIKRNNRIINRNRVVVRNIRLPGGARLPPNVSEKITRLTAFGKKRKGVKGLKKRKSLTKLTKVDLQKLVKKYVVTKSGSNREVAKRLLDLRNHIMYKSDLKRLEDFLGLPESKRYHGKRKIIKGAIRTTKFGVRRRRNNPALRYRNNDIFDEINNPNENDMGEIVNPATHERRIRNYLARDLSILESTDQFGRTPLMAAVLSNDPIALKVILRFHPDINKIYEHFTFDRVTPLMAAARLRSYKIVRMLVNAGADIGIRIHGRNVIDMINNLIVQLNEFNFNANSLIKIKDYLLKARHSARVIQGNYNNYITKKKTDAANVIKRNYLNYAYTPGGPGYNRVKKHFETAFGKKRKIRSDLKKLSRC
jgi:ankyrin repeat protein